MAVWALAQGSGISLPANPPHWTIRKLHRVEENIDVRRRGSETLMDGIVERRRRLVRTFSWALCAGVIGVLGFRDIPSNFSFVYVVGNIVFIYSIFAMPGLFSVYDIIGWLNPPSSGVRCQSSTKLIRIKADRRRRDRRHQAVGVVLAGGGGKGAYQIGCWKAMQRRGLKVDAVSGTSVGALNAAMMARADSALTEYIEFFWRHMSASQLLKLDVVALLFAPLA